MDQDLVITIPAMSPTDARRLLVALIAAGFKEQASATYGGEDVDLTTRPVKLPE